MTRIDLIRAQYRIVSSLLFDVHLPHVTDELLRWLPGTRSLTVHRDDAGFWRADWPNEDVAPDPPASAAWLTWHVLWWWTQTGAAIDGRPVPAQDDVCWPGDSAAVRAALVELHDGWQQRLGALDDADLERPIAFPWPQLRPLAHTLGWVNLELMKNTAELGQLRHIFTARAVTDDTL